MAARSDGFTYPPVEKRMSTMLPGARRRRRKITTDMPKSVTSPMPSRCAMYAFTPSPRVGRPLLVAPHVLEAGEVVDVVVRHQPLYVWPVREVVEPLREDGTGRVLLEALLDRDHLLQALLRIELLRLAVEHLHDLLAAVLAVVARRAAPVVLVEVRVGIVGAESRQVRADLVVPARGHGMPLGRLHLL